MRLLILAFVLATSVFTARAELVWEKTEQSFKTVPGQVTVKTSYPFKNTGTTAVTLTGLKSSCGCTSAVPSKMTYAPGESGTIDVVFSIGSRTGPQKKTILVATDGNQTQELLLNVEIPVMLRMEPAFLFWSTSTPAEEKTVTLTMVANPPIKVLGVISSEPRFNATLEPLSDGVTYRVHIKPQNTDSPADGWIEVQTDIPPEKGLRYRIFVEVKKIIVP